MTNAASETAPGELALAVTVAVLHRGDRPAPADMRGRAQPTPRALGGDAQGADR
jgi:hypothetical protein